MPERWDAWFGAWIEALTLQNMQFTATDLTFYGKVVIRLQSFIAHRTPVAKL